MAKTPLDPVQKQYKKGSACKFWKAGYDCCENLVREYQKNHPATIADGGYSYWPDIHVHLDNEKRIILNGAKTTTPSVSDEKRDKFNTGFDCAHKTCTDVGTFKDWQKKQESGQLVFDKP